MWRVIAFHDINDAGGNRVPERVAVGGGLQARFHPAIRTERVLVIFRQPQVMRTDAQRHRQAGIFRFRQQRDFESGADVEEMGFAAVFGDQPQDVGNRLPFRWTTTGLSYCHAAKCLHDEGIFDRRLPVVSLQNIFYSRRQR